MKKTWKQILICLLAVALVTGIMPVNVDAAPSRRESSVIVRNVEDDTLVMEKNQTYQLIVKTSKFLQRFTYESTNAKVVKVNSHGRLTAVKEGTAQIMIGRKGSSKKTVITIIVGKRVKSVRFNKNIVIGSAGRVSSCRLLYTRKTPL